jgi:hypothetical protein
MTSPQPSLLRQAPDDTQRTKKELGINLIFCCNEKLKQRNDEEKSP